MCLRVPPSRLSLTARKSRQTTVGSYAEINRQTPPRPPPHGPHPQRVPHLPLALTHTPTRAHVHAHPFTHATRPSSSVEHSHFTATPSGGIHPRAHTHPLHSDTHTQQAKWPAKRDREHTCAQQGLSRRAICVEPEGQWLGAVAHARPCVPNKALCQCQAHRYHACSLLPKRAKV